MFKAETLPELRKELEILRDVEGDDDAVNWIIHDPIMHRYFRVNAATKSLIDCWGGGQTLSEIQQRYESETGSRIDGAHIETFTSFLRRNSLTTEDGQGIWHSLADQASKRHLTLAQMPRKLTFFKIPLVRPQRMLLRTLPYLTFLVSKSSLTVLALMACVGLYLISRQWDSFIASFPQFLTPSGLVLVAISLVVAKCLHELGHAYTAVAYGCRIPTMGVAFMFLTPMLYTDVSDAWRLSSREKRIWISAAGVITELTVAIIATFVWAFLPDGTARAIAFSFAATGWILSLLFNLNPLMKFDGYYIFSDWLGIENLQARANAMGRWQLRRLLLAPTLPPPETLRPATARLLIIYGALAWLYRLTIFVALALLVYHMVFKLLGIVLFAGVLWLLVLSPIISEIASWRNIPIDKISPRNAATACVLAAILGGVFFVPWSGRVNIPAIAMPRELIHLYPERAGRVAKVNLVRGQIASRHRPLIAIEAPQLDNDLALVSLKLQQVESRLANALPNQQDLDERIVLTKQRDAIKSELQGLKNQQNKLHLEVQERAVVVQVANNLHVGRWIGKNELIAVMAVGEEQVLRGYVGENNLHRMKIGQTGRFIPELASAPSIRVRLDYIDVANSHELLLEELASVSGGVIAAERVEGGQLRPRGSQFKVRLSPIDQGKLPAHITRGLVVLDGEAESMALAMWRQVTRVIVREFDF